MMHSLKRRWQEELAANDASSAKTASDDAQPLPLTSSHTQVKAGFESFDLSPRLDKMAKDVLPSLRYNKQMKAGVLAVGLDGLVAKRASMQTGLVAFSGLQVQACQELAAYLRHPENRSPEGYLILGGRNFPGYALYDRVHGKFNPGVQAKQTAKFHSKADVTFVLQHSKPLLKIFLLLLSALGVDLKEIQDAANLRQAANKYFKRCRAIHFLQQDKHANALFAWHDDLQDLKGLRPAVSDKMVTAIVQLNDGETAMRLHDFQPHKFTKAGDAVLFNGAAVHESLPWKDSMNSSRVVFKVAFFMD